MTGAASELLTATAELLDQLFVLVRQIAVHGREADSVAIEAAALQQAIARAKPPFSIQLFADVLLRDRVPLALSVESFRRCQQLIGACGRWGAQELIVEQVPTTDDLIGFAEALFGATNTQRSTRAPQRRGLRLKALWRIGSSPAPSEGALAAFLDAELAGACEDAQRLRASAGGAWPFGEGRALTFRLERCLLAGVSASARALELGALSWSPACRSVACALHVGSVLARMQVSPLSQRAAMHAALVIAAHGLAERGGAAFHEAARAALPGVLAADLPGEVDPQRLRTCTLLQAGVRYERVQDALAMLPLLHAAYELERKRSPRELDQSLSRMELQAWLADALGREVHEYWGRALLGLLGLVPVGSYVLADGRLGVVVAPSDNGDPWRPRVLVGGQLLVPQQPVQLHSPLATT
jgi:hypothetical protein